MHDKDEAGKLAACYSCNRDKVAGGKIIMTAIPLTRCQFLMPFAQIHSEIGGSTSALLATFQLPTCLEEKADHYVPLLPAVGVAAAAKPKQGKSNIGF